MDSEKQAYQFLTRIYYYELAGPTGKGRYSMIDDKTIWYCFYFITKGSLSYISLPKHSKLYETLHTESNVSQCIFSCLISINQFILLHKYFSKVRTYIRNWKTSGSPVTYILVHKFKKPAVSYK